MGKHSFSGHQIRVQLLESVAFGARLLRERDDTLHILADLQRWKGTHNLKITDSTKFRIVNDWQMKQSTFCTQPRKLKSLRLSTIRLDENCNVHRLGWWPSKFSQLKRTKRKRVRVPYHCYWLWRVSEMDKNGFEFGSHMGNFMGSLIYTYATELTRIPIFGMFLYVQLSHAGISKIAPICALRLHQGFQKSLSHISDVNLLEATELIFSVRRALGCKMYT